MRAESGRQREGEGARAIKAGGGGKAESCRLPRVSGVGE